MIPEYFSPLERTKETELQKFYSDRGKKFVGLLDNASYLSARNRWNESKQEMDKAKEILSSFESDRAIPKKIYDAAKQHLHDTERRIKCIGVQVSS